MEVFQFQVLEQQQMIFPVLVISTQSASSSIFPSSRQFQLLCQAKTSTFRFSPLLSSNNRRLNASFPTKYSKWDSNVEGTSWKRSDDGETRSRSTTNRRWWSVESDLADDNDETVNFFEEAIDSIWIIKVFRSYGWTLPVLLLSLLLATGPKAFLLALALCIAQSALTLALNKLFGAITTKTTRRRRRRKPKRK